jgi:hypothetical protein
VLNENPAKIIGCTIWGEEIGARGVLQICQVKLNVAAERAILYKFLDMITG